MEQSRRSFPRNLSRPETVPDSLEYIYFAFSFLEEIEIKPEHVRGMRIEGDEICLVLDDTADSRYIAHAELLVIAVKHHDVKDEEVYPLMGSESVAKRGINQWRCSVVRDGEVLVWFKLNRSKQALEDTEKFLVYGIGHHPL